MPNLFEELIRDGEAGINRLVADRRQEDVELDFKTQAGPKSAALQR